MLGTGGKCKRNPRFLNSQDHEKSATLYRSCSKRPLFQIHERPHFWAASSLPIAGCSQSPDRVPAPKVGPKPRMVIITCGKHAAKRLLGAESTRVLGILQRLRRVGGWKVLVVMDCRYRRQFVKSLDLNIHTWVFVCASVHAWIFYSSWVFYWSLFFWVNLAVSLSIFRDSLPLL